MKNAMGELNFNQLDQVSGGRGFSGKLDSLGDLSMEKQMRLQMYMEAFNQASAMFSNILKSFGRTAGQITQNMK